VFETFSNFLIVDPTLWAFVAIVGLLLICGLGLPMPEEFPLFYSGYLAYRGVISIEVAIAWCLFAILAGDSLLFGLGYSLGQKILDWPWFKKIFPPDSVEKVNVYFRRYGSGVVFVARFLPGLRGPVFLMTGVLRMRYRNFLLFDGLASLISAPFLIWVAYKVCHVFSGEIHEALRAVRKTERVILGVALVLVTVIFVILHRRKKQKLAPSDT